MEQRNVSNIKLVFGVIFIFFGVCMLMIGIPLVFEPNRDSTINFITFLALLGGSLLIVGGIQNIKKAKKDQKSVIEYQQSVFEQLAKNKIAEKPNITEKENVRNAEIQSENNTEEKYSPDILAQWYYTNQEWKKMTKEERSRRIKEALWLGPLIGVLGSLLLIFTREADKTVAILVSFFIGFLITGLKIIINLNELKSQNGNNIIFTTNALVINGKFKTISSTDINLEYLKFTKHELGDFIEFSIQWATRGGITNDQFRILIPEKYKDDVKNIFEYYNKKGVKTEF